MTLRTAVVGCGLIGTRRAEHAAASDASTLVLSVDTLEAAARGVAERFGGQWGTDWRAAVADAGVDAVIVATPNAYLAEIGIAALEEGKHVLIEKPMGRDLAEAEALAAMASVSKGLLKIGFNHRYHPALREARELFAGGASAISSRFARDTATVGVRVMKKNGAAIRRWPAAASLRTKACTF